MRIWIPSPHKLLRYEYFLTETKCLKMKKEMFKSFEKGAKGLLWHLETENVPKMKMVS